MSQLTVSEAIRAAPVGRTTFYSKYVNTGKISVSVDSSDNKYVDSSELIRVFGGEVNFEQPDSSGQEKTNKVEHDEKTTNNQSEIIKLLKAQLAEQKADSEKREQFYQSQIISLTNRLEASSPVKKQNWFMRFWNAKD